MDPATAAQERELTFTNIRELKDRARQVIDPIAFDYIAGGAEDEVTLAANRDDWGRWRFVPRMLRDVTGASTATTILGQELSAPILVAPTAFHQLVHPEGEVATAQGARDAGSLYVGSTLANRSFREIDEAAPGPKWLQVYVFKDRTITQTLVDEARSRGCTALVLTVDVPVAGRRERDDRNRFALPHGLRLGNFEGIQMTRRPGRSGLVDLVASQFDGSLSWSAVEWLKDVSGLPVLVKGILAPEDAALAVEHGAAGVVVSNHGGRQLDHAVSGAVALPGVVKAVDGRVPVFVDGGVQRGTDILKALALGAQGVFVGRPIIWGLALAGRRGVADVLAHLRTEMLTSMQLLGATSPDEIDGRCVVRADA
jgi:isopentenyl diphosphate isomerase/L-lactate dehydrogenase-like FMN-dependent dehydrogenase